MEQYLNNTKYERCPCCGYYTIKHKGSFEICYLCDWEDDGQNDSNADRITGGPNGDYSLTEARKNFTKYLIMYQPSDIEHYLEHTIEIRKKKHVIMYLHELINKGIKDVNTTQLLNSLASQVSNSSERIYNNWIHISD